MAAIRASRTALVVSRGWPPPPMQPPGQVMISTEMIGLLAASDGVDDLLGVAHGVGYGDLHRDALEKRPLGQPPRCTPASWTPSSPSIGFDVQVSKGKGCR